MNRSTINLSCALLILCSYSHSANANENSKSSITVSGNVLFATQYNFRGISVSDRKPAVQGGLNLLHDSGFYLNFWASNQEAIPDSSLEADAFFGYIWNINENSYLDVGVSDVNYIGAPDELNADFNEFNIIYSHSNLFKDNDNIKASLYYSPQYTTKSGKQYYSNISYSYPINQSFNLVGSAGYTLMENNEKFAQVFGGNGDQDGYLDYKIAIQSSFIGLDTELSWTDTTIDTTDKNMQGMVTFSIGKTF